MIEIWQECARFQKTRQRLTQQIRTIRKKGWVSNLEILEIHQKISNEQNCNKIPNTFGINKEKHPNRNELPNSEKGNTAQPNNAQPNDREKTLTQE